MNGKGDKRRPENQNRFSDGWELAYGKKEGHGKYISVRKQKKERAECCQSC